jgi:surface polysaccharide O-acyltransferase-like enzyme
LRTHPIPDNKDNSHLQWIDTLRAIATVSIILLHLAAGFLYQYGPGGYRTWWIGNVYDAAVRFSVPVFIMITGALLLHEDQPWPVFYKKRFFRLIPPFLFWSFVYIVYSWYVLRHQGQHTSFSETVNWALLQLWNGSSYHFWYMYMIIGFYFFMPLIRAFTQMLNEKGMLFLLGVWFIVLCLTCYKPAYFPGYTINMVFGGYLLLGYYLRMKSFANVQRTIKIAWLCIIAGTLITIFGTYFITDHSGKFDGTFYSFLSPNAMLTATGSFLLCKNYTPGVSNIYLLSIRTLVSKYSYGIYLVHILVLSLLPKVGINHIISRPLVGIPITTGICLIISTAIIYGVNKLPLGKYISG